ncbi:hypothetical protein M405DRAFT_835321 [Rhizopogon salebrosus TDB-379]|nr:hypothetical protein M405DRAFT_835321 [Rhizopogon salebrosus TDB-379]
MITTTIVVGQWIEVRARLKQPSQSAMGRLNLMLRPTTTKKDEANSQALGLV